MLEAGADPNHALNVEWGWTPLRRAVLRSNLELTRMLVNAGADPFTVDDNGETLLFHLKWDEATPVFVDYVLGLGIDVNHQSTGGETALLQKVGWRDLRAVERLLRAGADPLIVNAAGHSAVDCAEQRLSYRDGGTEFSGEEPNAEIIRLLRDAIEERRSTTNGGSPAR